MLTYVILGIRSSSQNEDLILFLANLSYMYYGPFIPRLIISVRELYDRELRGRWQGIDTRFGVLSQPTSSGNVAMSAIAFVPGQDLAVEGSADDTESEAIQLQVIGGDVHQV